ncbi:MAG: hypothetical protein ACYTG2_08070 [Planctomycetota bacterium]
MPDFIIGAPSYDFLPLGPELFMQLWLGDPGAVSGVSLSPGLQITFED